MFNEVKNFEYYLELPMEIRAMIIDEMRTDDKCRFMRSSKICSREVQKSKKFSYAIQADFRTEDFIHMYIRYGNNEGGFDLHFTHEFGRNFLRYIDLDGRIHWMLQLLNSGTLLEHAMQHFELTLQYYQSSIKAIGISGWVFRSQMNKIRINVKSFNRLEELYVQDNVDIVQFVSKARFILKKLDCTGNQNCQGLANYAEIYHITDHLIVPHLRLNNHQFRSLSASEVFIHIGELQVEDIQNFILSWQHGLLRDNFKRCEWRLDGSNFNDALLFAILGGKVVYDSLVKTGITNFKEPWRTAYLTSSRYYVMRFVTN